MGYSSSGHGTDFQQQYKSAVEDKKGTREDKSIKEMFKCSINELQ